MPILQGAHGTSLEYSVSGEGMPIVLLSGLGSRRFVWTELSLELKEHYQVYACELRGGAKDRGFTIKDLAGEVARFMKELRMDGAVVVGHSQGGFVALELALAHQELLRGLVLAASASYTDEYGRTLLRHWRSMAERGEAGLLMDDLFLWNFSPHFCNERGREMRMLKSMVRKEEFDLQSFILNTQACESHETRERLSAIQVPVLLLGGEADIVMTQRHNRILKQLIPHSELVTLPRAGHNLVAEEPEAVLAPLRDFLGKLPGAPRGRGAVAGGGA